MASWRPGLTLILGNLDDRQTLKLHYSVRKGARATVLAGPPVPRKKVRDTLPQVRQKGFTGTGKVGNDQAGGDQGELPGSPKDFYLTLVRSLGRPPWLISPRLPGVSSWPIQAMGSFFENIEAFPA